MSKKDLKRGAILERLTSGKIVNKQAAKELKLDVRQIQRLKKRYVADGVPGIIHRTRGRPSGRSMPTETKEKIVERLHNRYPDFGATLAVEKLLEEYEIKASIEYVRQLQIAEGLRTPKKRKQNSRYHPRRTRRARRGELVQVDGSDHLWFEDRGERCWLISFVDDATSEVLFARFVTSESYKSYSEGMRDFFTKAGLPEAFYSDKHGVFWQSNQEARNRGELTELGKNLTALDVEIICANSPQAKGRIERSFGTHQDRLIKEMRLAGVSNMGEGNQFLEKYVPKHNKRFSVPPSNPKDSYRALGEGVDLNIALGRKQERKLSKDLSFQYENILYQACDIKYPRRAKGAEVTIRRTLNGELSFTMGNQPLVAKPYNEFPAAQRTLDAKDISTAEPKQKAKKPHKHHPWR